MPGYAHIFRIGMREGTYDRIVGEYQFTYSEGGKTWVRTFDDEAALSEFLRSDIAIPADIIEKALEDLRRAGKTTIADVEIRESEAPAMGLEQSPSDASRHFCLRERAPSLELPIRQPKTENR